MNLRLDALLLVPAKPCMHLPSVERFTEKERFSSVAGHRKETRKTGAISGLFSRFKNQ